MKRNTEMEYRDLAAYCRVNTKMDPDFFLDDLYKTGYKADLHRADVKAERTVKKVEARLLATAVALVLGTYILCVSEVRVIVDGLMPRVMQLMESNMDSLPTARSGCT